MQAKLAKASWGTLVTRVGSADHIDLPPSTFGAPADCSGYVLVCSNGDMGAQNVEFGTPRYCRTDTFNAWVVTFRSVTSGNTVTIDGHVRINWLLLAP